MAFHPPTRQLFAGITPELQESLINEYFEPEIRFERGNTTIASTGGLKLIVEGHALISLFENQSMSLGPGDFYGELGSLTGSSTGIVSKGDWPVGIRVLKLSGATLDEPEATEKALAAMYAKAPAMAANMVVELARRVAIDQTRFAMLTFGIEDRITALFLQSWGFTGERDIYATIEDIAGFIGVSRQNVSSPLKTLMEPIGRKPALIERVGSAHYRLRYELSDQDVKGYNFSYTRVVHPRPSGTLAPARAEEKAVPGNKECRRCHALRVPRRLSGL
ncbi:MAG: hypothetical protein M0Z69_15135 [Actinomycetota bacterium]|nr:hypothetical protein [Actinomycetota bacterium]